MWSDLSSDLLAHIFSLLPPDSFACAKSVCRNWHESPDFLPAPDSRRRHPAWFIALPNRNRSLFCYAHDPVRDTRYELHLDFVPAQTRPVTSVGGLIVLRPNTASAFQLSVCNPFTRQFRHLPKLNVSRSNPAVGAVELDGSQFRVFVVGGMSGSPSGEGAASYEPTIETYDSVSDSWTVNGSAPVEFAVRLTVWTPNESVYCDGVLYWMTSARAYIVMGFEISTNHWRELSVPIADRLEFASLMRRNGKLTLIGGKCGGDAYVWELGEGDAWRVVEKVPNELGMKFLGGTGCWDSTKCVGNDGMLCLYKDLGSGMLVWKKELLENRKFD